MSKPSRATRTLPALTALFLGVLLFPEAAHAAFVGTDGTDPDKMARDRVAIAVVEVAAEHVDQARKTRGFVLYRHLDLKILRHLHGPPPEAAGLTQVPYSPMVNSAWPVVEGSLVGRRFLMAWRHGHACGLGSTVSFGPRVNLPLLVRGPDDPWVAAVTAFVALPRTGTAAGDLALMRGAFRDARHPRLALLADAALLRLDPSHRASPARLLGLLTLVDPSPKADDLLGVTLLADLQKIPAARGPADYARQWGGPKRVPSGLGFDAFRQRLLVRLLAFAANTHAEKELRRVALMGLAAPPVLLAAKEDPMNARAVETVLAATRDGIIEVRRSALVAAGLVAKALAQVDPRQARSIRQAVRAGVRREPSPAERAIVIQQLGGLPRP